MRQPDVICVTLQKANAANCSLVRKKSVYRFPEVDVNYSLSIVDNGVSIALNDKADRNSKEALLKAQSQPLRRKLIIVVLDSSAAYAWGGERIVINGENVGELTSVGWSPRTNACVGMGYARSAAAMKTHAGAPAQIELWGELVEATAWDQ